MNKNYETDMNLNHTELKELRERVTILEAEVVILRKQLECS